MDRTALQNDIEVCGRTGELEQLIDARDWNGALDLLSQLRAADEAGLLCEMDRNRARELLSMLSITDLSEILDALPVSEACRFCGVVEPDTLADMLDMTTPERAAQVLRELPEDQSRRVLSLMEDRSEVTSLLQYVRGTAGSHMSPAFVALAPDMTADDAIAALRGQKPHRDMVDTLYIVGRRGRLRGVVTLRQLILAPAGARLRTLMERKILSVTPETDERECARLMQHYNISSLPVVDADKRMLGIITLRELLHVTQDQATADMYHMVGLRQSERLTGTLSTALRRRLPWLVMSLGMALISGLVVSAFQSTIAMFVALAAFLPLISAQGTNSAVQTATIFVRSLATGELRYPMVRRAIARETTLAFINAAAIAALAGIIAYFWIGDVWLAQVLAVSMFLTMGLSGLLGALVPIALGRLRSDPALGSSVLLATATDVTGFILLLGIATLMAGVITGS